MLGTERETPRLQIFLFICLSRSRLASSPPCRQRVVPTPHVQNRIGRENDLITDSPSTLATQSAWLFNSPRFAYAQQSCPQLTTFAFPCFTDRRSSFNQFLP